MKLFWITNSCLRMGVGLAQKPLETWASPPHPPTALPPVPLTASLVTFIRILHPTVPLTPVSTWRSPCVSWVTLTRAEWSVWACTLGLFSRFLKLVILPWRILGFHIAVKWTPRKKVALHRKWHFHSKEKDGSTDMGWGERLEPKASGDWTRHVLSATQSSRKRVLCRCMWTCAFLQTEWFTFFLFCSVATGQADPGHGPLDRPPQWLFSNSARLYNFYHYI